MEWRKHLVRFSFAGAALAALLSGCGTDEGLNNGRTNMQSVPAPNVAHQHDAGIIPNFYGPKTETTNEKGSTSSGMGMSIYSRIGSSGLHEGGVSSHIQSRIAGLGNEGIRAFVLNDTVILARQHSVIPSSQYDDVQRQVLSPMEGLSGKGDPEGIPNESGQAGSMPDNLELAKKQVSEMFNGNVQILTVTNPQAFELMDRIVTKLHSSKNDPTLGQDIVQLLQMTSEE